MTFDTISDGPTLAGDSAGAMLAGRYRIVRQLGQGGMGSVWLAEDTLLDNKPFAIKMLPTILVSNKRAYRQLKDEALVAMKLTHPNIVTLRAFEENNGNPFLVMDYIDGQTLDDYLCERETGNGERGNGLSEEEVIRVLRPIAAALDYAHGEGVVHRDVKPANVMIRKDGHPFILDFGIAREIQETMTRVTGKLSSGTLLYMSPEQLNGEKPTPAQDVYSFAAMAYECLKGEPPFVRGQIEHQILNVQPEPLDCGAGVTGTTGVSPVGNEERLHRSGGNGQDARCPSIAASVMAGLAKKPEDRPPTCSGVLVEKSFSRAERVERAESGGRMPSSVAGGTAGVSRKESKERKAGGGKALAILALLAALAGGGVWFYYQQQEADQREQSEIAERNAAEQRNAELAKNDAESAKGAAQKTKADEYATDLWTDATNMFKRAEVDFSTNGFVVARAHYEEATRKFNGALDKAQRVIRNQEENRKADIAAKEAVEGILKEAEALEKKVVGIADNDDFKRLKDGLVNLLVRAKTSLAEKSWGESAQLFTNYVNESKALIALDGERNKAVEKRDQAEAARESAGKSEADKFAAKQWSEANSLMATANTRFELGRFAEAPRSFTFAAEKYGKCVGEARQNAIPSLRVVATIDGNEVKGAMLKTGRQDFPMPITWTNLTKGIYGPYKVSCEQGGHRYYGTFNAMTVDWQGQKEVLIELKEYTGPQNGDTKTITLPGGATMEMIYVAPNRQMKGFWIGKSPVTQGQWSSVMNDNPSYFRADINPVNNVSWDDCQTFLGRLLGHARLPRLAEVRNCNDNVPINREWCFESNDFQKLGFAYDFRTSQTFAFLQNSRNVNLGFRVVVDE